MVNTDLWTVAICAAAALAGVVNASFFSSHDKRRAASVGLTLVMFSLAVEQVYFGLGRLLLHRGVDVRGQWFDAPITLMIELFLVFSLLVISSICVFGRR